MQVRKLTLSSVDLDIDGRQPMREAMLRAMASVSSSHPPFAILSADGDCVCTASVPISPRAVSLMRCCAFTQVQSRTRRGAPVFETRFAMVQGLKSRPTQRSLQQGVATPLSTEFRSGRALYAAMHQNLDGAHQPQDRLSGLASPPLLRALPCRNVKTRGHRPDLFLVRLSKPLLPPGHC